MSALWFVLHGPDCNGPRIKGRGWSAQPEVGRECFDVNHGGLQQAGDGQERDGRRVARRSRAPDDPGLSPGSLRHHRPEHLTVALEAVGVEQQMKPPRPLAGIRPARAGRSRWTRRADGPGASDASGTQGSIEKARSHSRDDGPAMSQS